VIGVVGSLNLDLVARVPQIPAAGETVLGSALARHHGGKGGNQAVAAARLGAAVRFYGAVGDDGFADELAAGLLAEGIDIAGLQRTEGSSGCALISVADSGENAISVLPGANDHAPLPPAAWPAELRCLLMQLEIPLPTVLAWAAAAQRAGVPLLLNAAPMRPLAPALLQAVDTLMLNEVELQALCSGDLAAAAALGPRRVVVTKGARGAAAWHDGRVTTQAARDVWVTDSTGAGDCFAGALATALWQGRPFEDALHRAGVAAALACTRVGARSGMPTAAELEAALRDPP
jgi:ribokinase